LWLTLGLLLAYARISRQASEAEPAPAPASISGS
jgi:hypothetical protein